MLEGEDVDPQYVQLEIMDVFPHDHPLLDKDPDYSDMAREMSKTLNDIVKNSYEGDEKIRGYMFVFDASNKNTFDSLSCLIETIKEIEKSDRKGKKSVMYTPKKILIANKKDLKKKKGSVLDKADMKKLDGIRYKEVSAMTNNGVYEAFKMVVSDIHNCNILHKEYFDREKQRNKDIDNENYNRDDVGYNLFDRKLQDNMSNRPERKNTGLIGMLPFFGCYGVNNLFKYMIQARDDDEGDEEEEIISDGGGNLEDPENQDLDDDIKVEKGQDGKNCILF